MNLAHDELMRLRYELGQIIRCCDQPIGSGLALPRSIALAALKKSVNIYGEYGTRIPEKSSEPETVGKRKRRGTVYK